LKVVNEQLKAGQSLIDKIWNDAMETAALHVEYDQDVFNGMWDTTDAREREWLGLVNRIYKRLAEEFRKEKR
jgi:hypothetical protein